jgi:hypothetical protein
MVGVALVLGSLLLAVAVLANEDADGDDTGVDDANVVNDGDEELAVQVRNRWKVSRPTCTTSSTSQSTHDITATREEGESVSQCHTRCSCSVTSSGCTTH